MKNFLSLLSSKSSSFPGHEKGNQIVAKMKEGRRGRKLDQIQLANQEDSKFFTLKLWFSWFWDTHRHKHHNWSIIWSVTISSAGHSFHIFLCHRFKQKKDQESCRVEQNDHFWSRTSLLMIPLQLMRRMTMIHLITLINRIKSIVVSGRPFIHHLSFRWENFILKSLPHPSSKCFQVSTPWPLLQLLSTLCPAISCTGWLTDMNLCNWPDLWSLFCSLTSRCTKS